MLQQQVNLYNAIPKAPKYALSGHRCLQAIIAFAILLVFIFCIQLINFFFQNWQLSRLKSHQQALSMQIEQLGKNGTLPINVQLKQDNQKLTEELTTKTAELKELGGSLTSDQYPGYLIGLAKTIVPNVWLKTISIRESGQQITLTGSGLSAPAILDFVENVRHSPEFANSKLEHFSLINAQQATGYIDFILSTQPIEHVETNASTTPKAP